MELTKCLCGEEGEVYKYFDGFYVMCTNCEKVTPVFSNRDSAIASWNERITAIERRDAEAQRDRAETIAAAAQDEIERLRDDAAKWESLYEQLEEANAYHIEQISNEARDAGQEAKKWRRLYCEQRADNDQLKDGIESLRNKADFSELWRKRYERRAIHVQQCKDELEEAVQDAKMWRERLADAAQVFGWAQHEVEKWSKE